MKKISILLVIAVISLMALAGCSSNSSSSVKSGVEDMLKVTGELQDNLKAGNEEKVKELGHELEEVWEKFEDEVKDANPALYEEVEDALDPTIAGTEARPLDKEIVSNFNQQLTDALNELAETVK